MLPINRLAFIAGLLLAGAASFGITRLLPVRSPWHILLGGIFAFVIPVLAGIGVSSLASRNAMHTRLVLIAASVWLPALGFLYWQHSPWTAIPACIAAAAATLALGVRWPRGLPGAIVAGLLLQLGVLALAPQRVGLAAALFALAAAIVAARVESRPGANRYRSAAAAAVAFSMLLFAMINSLPRRHGGDGEPGSARRPGTRADARLTGKPDGFGGVHRGIILWPEQEEHTTLVPPPRALRGIGRSGSNPLSIPFYGVYWLFRFPHQKPPEDSYRLRGNPDTKTFRSADFVPLRMEAHQNFGQSIPMDCCRAIQLAIRNGDRYHGRQLELVLVDTASKGSFSLGKADITSRPRWLAGQRREPRHELLSYAMPDASPLAHFDEATIVFHGHRLARHVSANVAIERFVLVPKGR